MKINITEEEKRNILKMHKSLMLEQTQTTGGLTHGGGADKEYCSNLESKLQRELQDVLSGGINVKDFTIKTQPNHEKSFFGEFTYRSKGKSESYQVVVCQSKNGEKINPYWFSSTDGFKKINNGASLIPHQKLYAKMCERINTCAGFGAQPQS